MTAYCCLCLHPISLADVDAHMEAEHPAEWDGGPERWPDGTTVVYDTTLTPEDFA